MQIGLLAKHCHQRLSEKYHYQIPSHLVLHFRALCSIIFSILPLRSTWSACIAAAATLHFLGSSCAESVNLLLSGGALVMVNSMVIEPASAVV